MTGKALVAVEKSEILGMLAELGEPAWRARQINDAVWQPHIQSFADIKVLPSGLRDALATRLAFSSVTVGYASEADAGETVKLLCTLADGQTVESVAMATPATAKSKRRATVCVSSQVGCAVGCPFCATGQMGLRRNCTAAEIVDQVRAASREFALRDLGPVTHVVFMGMGEPLSNVDEVVMALRLLTGSAGISARRITVSTSGIIPGIARLSEEGIPVTLAISLHAADDELRNRLVPVSKKYPLSELKAAAERYAAKTGRRVTLEWCLIGGVNDSEEQARGLRQIAHDLAAHVNIIPMNLIEGSQWGPPSKRRTERFLELLDGVRVTVRDTRGSDTDAACGQLRAGLEQRRWLLPDGTLSRPLSVRPAAN